MIEDSNVVVVSSIMSVLTKDLLTTTSYITLRVSFKGAEEDGKEEEQQQLRFGDDRLLRLGVAGQRANH